MRPGLSVSRSLKPTPKALWLHWSGPGLPLSLIMGAQALQVTAHIASPPSTHPPHCSLVGVWPTFRSQRRLSQLILPRDPVWDPRPSTDTTAFTGRLCPHCAKLVGHSPPAPGP